VGRFQEKSGQVEIYDIQIAPEAQRGILSVPRTNRQIIIDAIDSLAVDARPSTSICLRNAENLRRLTVGDYRVVYGIEQSSLKITIELVRHRSIVYAGLAAFALTVRSKYSR